MSTDIEITSSGGDGINQIVSAIDRLQAGLKKLGDNTSGLNTLAQSVKEMQAQMSTGFAEMANIAKNGMAKQVEEVEAGMSRKLKKQLEWEAKQHAAANKFHDKSIEIEVAAENKRAAALRALMEKRDTEIHAAALAASHRLAEIQQRRDMEIYNAAAAGTQRLVEIQQRRDIEIYNSAAANTQRLMEIQQRRDTELHAEAQRAAAQQRDIQQRRDMEEYREAQAQAAKIIEIAQRRDVELHSMRQRAAQDAASAAEKQRILNTNFQTAGPASQLHTAKQAQVYGSLGGDAAARYGSSAAGADIRALEDAHKRLQQAVPGSTNSIHAHNAAMNEGHALARGLAGSLGGLWLTYGSLVPLAAGAAIAGSLKAIVEQGREVEYQLKFVEALTGSSASLDSLLKITDQTIVSVKEAAEGMRALAQNGLSAADSFRILPTILNLAVIGEMSVAQAALATTGAISAFGLALTDADHVANVFAQTAANSNTSVLAMTESIKQASTVASIYGATLEEAAGVIGVLAKSNITGGAAGTAYTNMLTGLYAPTEKAKKALKELGVSTDDGNGGLKSQTVLLDEVRRAMAQYADASRATFAADIWTVRGAKAADGVLKNWDQYIQKVGEAQDVTNFMGRAVAVLEDSTTGAFARLSNSVSSSLTQAFTGAGPALQDMTYHLAEIARSKEAVDVLTGMAQAAIRLATVIMDNGKALAYMIAGFVGLRIVSGVTAMLAAYSAAATAAAAATTAAAAATATLATRMAMVTRVFGWIGIAIGAVTAAWQLFVEKTPDVEVAAQRQQNTINSTIEFLNREITALAERNRLRDAKPAEDTIKDEVAAAEKALWAKRGEIAKLRDQQLNMGGPATTKNASEAGIGKVANSLAGFFGAEAGPSKDEKRQENQNKLNAAIAEEARLRKGLAEIREKAPKLLQGLSEEKFQNERTKTLKELQDLSDRGAQFDPKSDKFLGTENAGLVAKVKEAKQVQHELLTGQIELEEARGKLATLTKETSGLLNSRAGKPEKGDRAAASMAENTALIRLQGELEDTRDKANQTIADKRRDNARGELGDLALIRAEHEQGLIIAKKEIEIAQKKVDVSSKDSKDERYDNDLKKAKRKVPDLERVQKDKQEAYFLRLGDVEVQSQADAARRKGNLVDAYNLEYQAKNRQMLANLEKDIAAETDLGNKAKLESYKKTLGEMKQAGEDAALGQQLNLQMDLVFEKLNNRLSEQDDRSSGGAGLASIFDSALTSAQAYEDALPQLIAKQRELQDLANKTGNPADQTNADRAFSDIRKAGGALRNVWKGIGNDIASSLTNAFGKSGAALGKLLTSTIAYGAKRKQIDADYMRADKSDPLKLAEAQRVAAQDTASAQIAAYGEMTTAAKGFFNEGSKGYIALGLAEKTFRMAELAMTAQAMYQKLFATGVTTAAAVGGTTAEIAANKIKMLDAETSTAEIIALAMAEGQANALAGVAGQARGEPYSAFARMAAMAAAMAALGFMVSGGGGTGGGKTAAQMQETQGTGTVFGDVGTRQADGTMLYKQQSQSIANSLEILESNSDSLLPINQGMLSALRAIETSMTGLANLVIREPGVTDGTNMGIREGQINVGKPTDLISSVMTHITKGLLGPGLGDKVASFINNLWGKTTQNIVDSGIGISGSVRGLQAGQGYNQYASVDTTKSSWFGLKKSTSNSVQTTGLSGELTGQLSMIFTDMESALKVAATSMGGEAKNVSAALDSLSISASVSLKGLSGDALTQALNGVISKALDEMAAAAFPEMDKFRKVGEGYAETVIRLANDYAQIDASLEAMGKTFGAVGIGSLGAREALLSLSGGLDAFVSQADFFAKNFLSEEEQQAPIKKRVRSTLSAFSGGDATDTMDEFRTLVMSFAGDVSDSGMKAYATLMAIAPAFKEIYGAADTLDGALKKVKQETEDLQEELDDLTLTKQAKLLKERNALLSDENRLLFDQIQAAKLVVEAKDVLTEAYESEKKSIEDTVDRLKTLGASWKKFRDGLLLSDKSPLTPEQKYFEAKKQFESTLISAKGGDKDAQDRFEEVAQAFLDASRVSNSSTETYTADFNRVMAATTDAMTWAGQQVDVAKESLKALNAQVNGLIDIKNEVISVAAAIAALAQAMGKDPATAVGEAQDKGITSLYQNLLGRAPDAGGLTYWKNVMSGGATIADVGSSISQGQEYQQGKGIKDLYQNLLGREADKAGLDYWIKAMAANGASLDDVARAMRESAEYAQRNANAEVARATQSGSGAQQQPQQDGATQAQMERLIAEIEAARREQQQQVDLQVSAAFEAARQAAEIQAAATLEAANNANWKQNSKATLE